jgi:hypothetical protein
MRYRVAGKIIRSENAAQSKTRPSLPLVAWLHRRPITESALDYGCGKLRYTEHLAKRSKVLGLVDSEIQLGRTQTLDGKETTVRRYATAKWPTCRIHVLHEFLKRSSRTYDFVLCANVLSAIPSRHIRAQSLCAIRKCLSRGGTLLTVNQHTNSRFTVRRTAENARPHLDGWVLSENNSGSYFGVLDKDSTVGLLKGHGYVVIEAWIEGQSNYVLARGD